MYDPKRMYEEAHDYLKRVVENLESISRSNDGINLKKALENFSEILKRYQSVIDTKNYSKSAKDIVTNFEKRTGVDINSINIKERTEIDRRW